MPHCWKSHALAHIILLYSIGMAYYLKMGLPDTFLIESIVKLERNQITIKIHKNGPNLKHHTQWWLASEHFAIPKMMAIASRGWQLQPGYFTVHFYNYNYI